MGPVYRTMALARVMAITKWSISGSKNAAACAGFTSPVDARQKESPGVPGLGDNLRRMSSARIRARPAVGATHCRVRPGHDAQGCWARHDQLTEPRLRAFMCSECGTVESVLIPP